MRLVVMVLSLALLPLSAHAGQREVCIPEQEMIQALAMMDRRANERKIDHEELALRRALDQDQKALTDAQAKQIKSLEAQAKLLRQQGESCEKIQALLRAEVEAVKEDAWWTEAKHWAGHAALIALFIVWSVLK